MTHSSPADKYRSEQHVQPEEFDISGNRSENQSVLGAQEG